MLIALRISFSVIHSICESTVHSFDAGQRAQAGGCQWGAAAGAVLASVGEGTSTYGFAAEMADPYQNNIHTALRTYKALICFSPRLSPWASRISKKY